MFERAVLLEGQNQGRVLGVLGAGSGCVAFTYGTEQESIACWDLRQPASHAYRMATGNARVKALHWHPGTASLLANTFSTHGLTYGRARAYRYGDAVDLSEEDQEGNIGLVASRSHAQPRLLRF